MLLAMFGNVNARITCFYLFVKYDTWLVMSEERSQQELEDGQETMVAWIIYLVAELL